MHLCSKSAGWQQSLWPKVPAAAIAKCRGPGCPGFSFGRATLYAAKTKGRNRFEIAGSASCPVDIAAE
jgi:hypothetical protein